MSLLPSPNDPPTDFLVLIGRIVIGWARIERALDVAISVGKPLILSHFKDGIPQALKRKVRAMRALCKQLPSLSSQLSWVDSRLDDILELAEFRHTIIHGFFHGITVEAEPQIYFRRAPPLTGEAGERVIATRAELAEFVEKLRVADLDMFMMMTMAIQDARTTRRKASPPTPRPEPPREGRG
jgi:hypothetical protein